MCASSYLLLTALFLAAGSVSPATKADGPWLRVKPLICIAARNSEACASVFQIDWRSPQPGNYCLARDNSTLPVRCWTRAAAGEHRDRVVVTRDFYYWITESDSTQRLSAVKVEFLRLQSEDRRRERRSRHVWDVL
jgi:hypothetical protein